MSVINSDSMRAGAAGAGGAGYVISQSLRFNDDDSAYLSRTPSGAGNTRTWTFSSWVKISNIQLAQRWLGAGTGNSDSFIVGLTSGSGQGKIFIDSNMSSVKVINLQSNALLRDPSAWFHLVVAVDTTQSTASNRVRVYLNGSEVTSYSTEIYPDQNQELYVNSTSEHRIGRDTANGTSYIDGYMADVHLIDGQQLTASDFGESDDSGNWVPTDPSSLTFGTNGFHLDFAVAPGTGNGAGTDVSGNGNHFTDSGLAANDQVTDSPTDDAENDVGNYPTLSPLAKGSGVTLSNANLNCAGGSNQASNSVWMTQTLPAGAFYWESTFGATGNNNGVCIANEEAIVAIGAPPTISIKGLANVWMAFKESTTKINVTDDISPRSYTISTIDTTNDRICYAVDIDNLKFWAGFYDSSAGTTTWCDGSTGFTGNPAAGTNQTFTIDGNEFWIGALTHSNNFDVNFGQQAFSGATPTGFSRLMTANYPAPAIKDPSKYFQVDTFTGTGAELVRTLTDAAGGAVKPDLVWIKDRDTAVEHVLTDSSRGATKELNSDSTNIETTVAQGLKSFDTSGYTLGTDTNYNASSSLNVAWNWVKGSTPGFDIVLYTGNATARTISHGLTTTPEFIFLRNRNFVDGWAVYHASVGATKFLNLSSNAAEVTGTIYWNDTAPTPSVFSVGTSEKTNRNSDAFVAYLFAGIEGYSKFGSYEGNADVAGGVFVWLGFRPKFVLVKNIDATANWVIHDSGREPINVLDTWLKPDTTEAESAGGNRDMDFLSNGVRIFGNDVDANAANTYIFAAFAEFPFGGEDVSQARAR